MERPDFIEPDAWEPTLALITFSVHDVMESKVALYWLSEGYLQPSQDKIESSDLTKKSADSLCIRFTNYGRKAARSTMKLLGLNVTKLQSLKDPYLSPQIDLKAKYLMHDRRLKREIEDGDFDRLTSLYDLSVRYSDFAKH